MEQQIAVPWLFFSIPLTDGLFMFAGLTKKLKFLPVNRGFSAGAKWDLPVPENFGKWTNGILTEPEIFLSQKLI